MQFWIDDPSQSEPVGVLRWSAWKLSGWLISRGKALELIAMDQCPICGAYQNGRPHKDCDGIPF